jgi:putative ATP-binding cassette transporter
MSLISQAWQLGKDFFIDKEQRSKAYFLLITSIIFQLALVYGYVLMNKWSSDFYNALQHLDKEALYKTLKTFCFVVSFVILIFMAKYVCQARLALSWRKFLTQKYYSKWLNNQSYFGSNLLTHKNDNPDQRISEDIHSFVNLSTSLAFGILNAAVTLISFTTILWSLSGALKFKAFNIDFSIPGYLVWAALIYSIAGTLITYRIGKKLPEIDYLQEQKEANFRFSMMRLRENAGNIALYGGENYEKTIFKNALEAAINNTLNIISVTRNLGIWSNLYNQFANIFPILIACPRFFAKEIELGGLMQISNAFGKVEDSFSFFMSSFNTIASYRAVINRLNEFNQNIEHWKQASLNNKIQIKQAGFEDIIIKNLSISTPSNKSLITNLNLTLEAGESYLLTGKNGAGKSTLIQAMAGIWIFGEGEIIFPKNKSSFFIPQKPYMNAGTLEQVIMYPDKHLSTKEKMIILMKEVQLDYLLDRVDNIENWSISLSLGEQQKISILRAIIHNPDILIMDESTSALTLEDEKLIFKIIKEELPKSTIISIGHRESLKKFHNQIIKL